MNVDGSPDLCGRGFQPRSAEDRRVAHPFRGGILRCNSRVKKKLRNYENQKHLERVADEYISKIEEVNSPYHGWYNIFSPQIELSTVKNELLTLSEASKNFGINETDINHFIEKKQISCYTIKERNFIRTSEFEEIFLVFF